VCIADVRSASTELVVEFRACLRGKKTLMAGRESAVGINQQTSSNLDPPQGTRGALRIAWIPFEQACGCVIDWGWNSEAADLASFAIWCRHMVGANCPWHGGDTGRSVDLPPSELLEMGDPQSGTSYFCRMTTGEDNIALGRGLAAELRPQAAPACDERRLH
jgi:hypothetical protein